jgi:hypothetical protein
MVVVDIHAGDCDAVTSFFIALILLVIVPRCRVVAAAVAFLDAALVNAD